MSPPTPTCAYTLRPISVFTSTLPREYPALVVPTSHGDATTSFDTESRKADSWRVSRALCLAPWAAIGHTRQQEAKLKQLPGSAKVSVLISYSKLSTGTRYKIYALFRDLMLEPVFACLKRTVCASCATLYQEHLFHTYISRDVVRTDDAMRRKWRSRPKAESHLELKYT